MSEQDCQKAPRTPLHRRIAETLGDKVGTGLLKPGEKLPSERQIAQQFQASRATPPLSQLAFVVLQAPSPPSLAPSPVPPVLGPSQ